MPRSISLFVNFRAAKVRVNQFAPFLVQYQLVARMSKDGPTKNPSLAGRVLKAKN
jgi:hypothetical protein